MQQVLYCLSPQLPLLLLPTQLPLFLETQSPLLFWSDTGIQTPASIFQVLGVLVCTRGVPPKVATLTLYVTCRALELPAKT